VEKLKQWWQNEISTGVKFVLLVLLANGLPAFIILMSLPTFTEILFVWTIKPVINARLVGVMYSNALLLVAFGAMQKSWGRVRITMVVITLFSIFATLLTFVFLKPFLAHPWFHLAYWLIMYLVLFFAAPYIFITHEKKFGGKLPVAILLSPTTRLAALLSLLVSFVSSSALIFNIELVNALLPWDLPPLVGALIGVLFATHTAAYLWALWDGDWLRVRPIFWQAPPTALLFFLLPIVHASDLQEGSGSNLAWYLLSAGVFAILHLFVILSYRPKERSYVDAE
jgi:hypothetical protein